MNDTRTIEVKLFGALRGLAENATVSLKVATSVNVVEIRKLLKLTLGEQHPDFDSRILDASAFATPDRVLGDMEALGELNEIAVLPPVCGG